jgi:23S rRNA U2552 (ribose-2'-O)-methylase RlmE/FtsJ
MKELTKLGIYYSTDKAYFHSFTDFYDGYFQKFKNDSINILEIGIASGGSILTLKNFFKNANIYAIDIEPVSISLDLGENVYKYLCNQVDFIKLNNIFNDIKFDIIIDDGSHITSHQQKSLGFLFPFLKKNGIYICEDIHTSIKENSKNYKMIDTTTTTLEIFENFNKTGIYKCDIIDSEQNNYINNNIDSLTIYKRITNALECYGCRNRNINNNSTCICGINLSPSDYSITSVIIKK